MATLTAGDAERVLRFVADAAQIGGDEPFTDHILVELRKLVPADSVTYCEQDRVRQRVRITRSPFPRTTVATRSRCRIGRSPTSTGL
jgi:hypothetical protein